MFTFLVLKKSAEENTQLFSVAQSLGFDYDNWKWLWLGLTDSGLG